MAQSDDFNDTLKDVSLQMLFLSDYDYFPYCLINDKISSQLNRDPDCRQSY